MIGAVAAWVFVWNADIVRAEDIMATHKRPAAKKASAKRTPIAKKPATKQKPALKTPAPKPRSPAFAAVFDRLHAILAPHAKTQIVIKDAPGDYYLDTRLTHKGKPVFFAGTTIRNSYVSYYLFGLYCFPDLGEGMSATLRVRRQGKSCFNFSSVDDEAFRELAALTKKSAEAFRDRKLPDGYGKRKAAE